MEPEIKKTEETAQESPAKTKSVIQMANEAAERLEKANARHEELLKQEEEIRANNLLLGRGLAGQPQEKKEETPREYADRISKGIGAK